MSIDSNTSDDDWMLQLSKEPEFKPYSIAKEYRTKTFENVPESVKIFARKLMEQGWKFYAVNQNRGRCYYRSKTITIPVWAINKGNDYKTWYISHEMAHAFDTSRSNHGQPFMEQLKVICPENCIHFELGYKPRNAAAAGITKPEDKVNWNLLLD